jgi:hypothetical protein
MNARTAIRSATLALLVGVLLAFPSAPALALEHPPAGTPPSGFATQDTGCLGLLRSLIASGALAGVQLPDGFVIPDGFSGAFSPGGHFGTVQEAQFLASHGVADLDAFCSQFAP